MCRHRSRLLAAWAPSHPRARSLARHGRTPEDDRRRQPPVRLAAAWRYIGGSPARGGGLQSWREGLVAKKATGRVASAPVSALADASADETAVIEVPAGGTLTV